MKSWLIIFFCILTIVLGKAQTIGLALPKLKTPPQYLTTFLLKKPMQKSAIQQVVSPSFRPIPLVFNVETLPFFCKIEYQMGLNKKLPLKFRLGDVQYVDEMEGKRKSN